MSPSPETREYPLQTQRERAVTVVFNPVSGTGDPEHRKLAISDALATYGYTCQFIVTAPNIKVKSIVDQAVKEGADLITVAGGDGTVMEVLSALAGTGVPASIVPSGTGNLLSINLGIPSSVPDAIEVALEGSPRTIDLARATFTTTSGQKISRYFAIAGGMGLDAHMIKDADRESKRRLGILAYLRAILININRPRVWARVTVDGGVPLRRRVKTVMFANMAKMPGGLDAIPSAVPDDGKLDVGVITPKRFGDWVRLLWLAILGRPGDSPDMDILQGAQVRVRMSQPQPVEFDGESLGETDEVSVEILPGAVQVMLPGDSPAIDKSSGAGSAQAISRSRAATVVIIAAGLIAAAVVGWSRRRTK